MSKTDNKVVVFPKSFMSVDIETMEQANDVGVYIAQIKALQAEVVTLREEPVINPNEFRSIRALVAYAAFDKGIHEDVIRSMICARFNVDEIKNIRSRDYDQVVPYIINLNVKEAVN